MFGRDPFGNPFENMRRHMQDMDDMMNSMMGDSVGMFPGFFGQPSHRQITNGQRQNQQRSNEMVNHNNMMSPFGFGFGGGLFGGIINQMENMQNHAMNDPHSTVISQSTMISYDGNGQPKVVQASTRKAGDVKETRRSVHADGEERVSVGHTIGDRTHLIEKKKDKEGKVRQKQRFVNLDAEKAEDFNNEFKSKAARNLSSLFGNAGSGRYAIEENPRISRQAVSGSTAPIITVPDDDEVDDHGYASASRNGFNRYGRKKGTDGDYVHSNSGQGPTIREISEEDDEDVNGSNGKRRKVFGKLFRGRDE